MKTSISNEITLKFPSRSCNEGFARTAIACFAAQMDPTLNELEDIKTAVSEAVTNAIVHAYPDDIGTIWMKARIFDGDKLEIMIRDKGRGIENLSQAMEPLFTTNTDGERSGMGFTVMETFMDTVDVESITGVGTKVTLTKQIGKNRL